MLIFWPLRKAKRKLSSYLTSIPINNIISAESIETSRLGGHHVLVWIMEEQNFYVKMNWLKLQIFLYVLYITCCLFTDVLGNLKFK